MAGEFANAVIQFRLEMESIRAGVKQIVALMDQLDRKAQEVSQRQTTVPSIDLAPKKVDIKLDRAAIGLAGLQDAAIEASGKFITMFQSNLAKAKFLISSSQTKLETFDLPSKEVAKGQIAGVKDVIISSQSAKTIKEVNIALSGVNNLIKQIATQSAKLSESGLIKQDEGRRDVIRLTAAYNLSLKELGKAQDSLNKKLVEYKTTQDLAKKSVREQITAQDEFTNRLDIAINKLIRYRVAFTVMHQTILQIKDTVVVFAEVDHALAELAKVLPPIGTNLKEIESSAFRIGKAFGVSINEVLESMTVWAQLGLTQTETLKATEAALLAVNTTGLSATEATDALTAAIYAYNVSVGDLVTTVDKWMNVQADFAVSAQDLARALFVTGSAAEEFGVNIDQLNGLIAAIGTVTRATGKEVGNSLKTVFSRLATSESIRALQEVGVATFKNRGEFRNFFDILQDLAKEWPKLTDAQRANIAQTVSGVRQVSKFLALMNNFDVATAGVASSLNSAGAAMAANQIEIQTLSKSWESLIVTFDELKRSIGADLAKPIAELVNSLRSFADSSFGQVFAKLASFVIAAGTAFVFLKGSLIAVEFANRHLFSRSVPELIKSLTTLKIVTQGVDGTLQTTTKTLVGSAAVIMNVARSLNFIFAAISIGIGLWALFGKEVTNFNAAFATTEKEHDDFLKSIAARVKGIELEITSLDDSVKKRKELVESLEKTNKGSKRYGELQKELEQNTKNLTTASGELGAIIAKGNLDRASETSILESIISKTVELKTAKEKLLASEKELLKIEADRLKADAPRIEEQMKQRIENLSLSLEGLRGRVKDFSLENFMKNVFNEKEIKDASGGLQKFVLLLQDLWNSIEVNQISKNTLLSMFTGALNLGDRIRPVIESAKKPIEEFRKSLESDPLLPPETITKTVQGLETLLSTFDNFIVRLNKMDTDDPDALFSGIRLATLDLQVAFKTAMNNVVRTVENDLGLASAEAIAFRARMEQIMSGNFLAETPVEDNTLNVQFESIGKFAQETAAKIAALKFELDNGADGIKKLAEISRQSGGNFENLTKATALFYENMAKKIQTTIANMESDIVEAEASIETLREDLLKPLAPDFEKTTQQNLEKAMEEQEVRKQALETLRKMLDSYDLHINKAKVLNDILAEQNNSLTIATQRVSQFADITKDLTGLLSSTVFNERQIVEFEKERLAIEAQLVAEQLQFVDASERANFIRAQAGNLALKELDILRRMSTLSIATSFQDIQRATKVFVRDLQDAFTGAPDIIAEGFEQRQSLTRELKQAEQDLLHARQQGDKEATETALKKIAELKNQLNDYRKGWFEIGAVIRDITSNISSSIFANLSERLGQAIADIQLGDETLGITMGKAIAGEFDVSTKNLIDQYVRANDVYLSKLGTLYEGYLQRLAEIFGTNLPEIGSQFGAVDLNSRRNSPALRETGVPMQVSGLSLGIQEEVEAGSDALQRALRIGSLYAGQIISRSIAQAGGTFAQQLSGVLNAVALAAFPKQAASASGVAAISAGAGLAALGIGFLGQLLFGGKEDKIVETIQKNTEAIEGNTIALKEFEKGIFNAPPRFTFPNIAGNLTTGGGVTQIEINVQGGPNTSASQIADEVVTRLERTYRSDIVRTRNRGSIFA